MGWSASVSSLAMSKMRASAATRAFKFEPETVSTRETPRGSTTNESATPGGEEVEAGDAEAARRASGPRASGR